MDSLLAPIDPARAHEVGLAISWHGRLMVLAWGILAPLAILIARYFKVMPGQDWPRQLDNQTWWRSHWIAQSLVAVFTLIGLALILSVAKGGSWHGTIGYAIAMLTALQIASGIFRGTKGGPTAPAPDGSPRGDHYDMTPWRIAFEHIHKSIGYTLIALAIIAVNTGLWAANAPVWMFGTLAIWWIALLALALRLQSRGYKVDTYQAIWGPDKSHPGNTQKTGQRGTSRSRPQPGE